ncbi:uncharacterized protein [Penaeus vannamei]|uniref:uncharacterized protein n=1 Tax=Penaeus vannamei TaxID=6689 RepID=UPI00387F8DA4
MRNILHLATNKLITVQPLDFFKVACPEGFVSVQDGTSCLYFSSEAPSLGFAGAALSCGRKNASLALIKSVHDLGTAREDAFYYTAHNFRGDPSYRPSMPGVANDLTCEVDCQVWDNFSV